MSCRWVENWKLNVKEIILKDDTFVNYYFFDVEYSFTYFICLMCMDCIRKGRLIKMNKVPAAYIFGRAFLRGLFLEGLIFGGAYPRRGDLTEGFLRYEFRRLIFGGAYTWRGLFSEFYGIQFN